MACIEIELQDSYQAHNDNYDATVQHNSVLLCCGVEAGFQIYGHSRTIRGLVKVGSLPAGELAGMQMHTCNNVQNRSGCMTGQREVPLRSQPSHFK